MSQVIHILRKDILRLWPLLLPELCTAGAAEEG